MKKLSILVDIDGILADSLGFWLDIYNREWDDNKTKADITKWDLHHCVKLECGLQMYEIIEREGFFRDLEPLPGAVEAFNELRRQGHNLTVVSAPANSPYSCQEKIDWCKRYLGLSRKDIILTHKKELVHGDVLIDDSPTNLEKYYNKWCRFDQDKNSQPLIVGIKYPYNRYSLHAHYLAEDYLDTQSAWKSIVTMINANNKFTIERPRREML